MSRLTSAGSGGSIVFALLEAVIPIRELWVNTAISATPGLPGAGFGQHLALRGRQIGGRPARQVSDIQRFDRRVQQRPLWDRIFPACRGRPPRIEYTLTVYIVEALMRVSKWGNSLAVRLPDTIVKTLKLKSGDEIEIILRGERVFEVERDMSRERALARLRALKKPLPKGFRFDRGEANAR